MGKLKYLAEHEKAFLRNYTNFLKEINRCKEKENEDLVRDFDIYLTKR